MSSNVDAHDPSIAVRRRHLPFVGSVRTGEIVDRRSETSWTL